MKKAKTLDTATQLKELAVLNFRNNNLIDAYFYYLNCLKMVPLWKEDLKEDFLVVLNCLGQILEKKCNYSEIFTVYREALTIYDDSEELYHNLGAHLLRLGHPDTATYYFKEALNRNENYIPAFRNLQSAYCASVERWHYRMLNDFTRNEAYKKAICRKIQQGFDIALDIGTGTGLFCLFAAESGIRKMYACDYNPVMLSIASRVFKENSIVDKVNLINKHSNDIKIPFDIAERVSLVITETMDSCILGEHMLQSLKYAWDYLLHPPYQMDNKDLSCSSNLKGVVIPSKGSLWFVAVQSRVIAKNYMFPLPRTNAEACTFTLSNFSLTDTLKNFNNLKIDLQLRAFLNDPYDTERLQLLPDCTFLTTPQELFCINFNNPEEIDKSLRNGNQITFDIPCTQEGYMHVLGSWFQIQLDENSTICSAPNDTNSKDCCWDQAIFPCMKPYHLVPGSKIKIAGDWSGGKVCFDVKYISHPGGEILNNEPVPMTVSRACISMLNDTNLTAHLTEAAVEFIQKYRVTESLRILDLFAVPVFGLTVLCNLHLMNRLQGDIELISVISSPEDMELISKIAESNGIRLSMLSFIEEDAFEERIINLSRQYLDVAVVNVISTEGDMAECSITRINILKSLLKKDGIILPREIGIAGQIIYSEYIEKSMRIIDDDIFKRGIGSCLNEFQVSQMLEVNITSLPFEAYSVPFICHQFSIYDLDIKFSTQLTVPMIKTGNINSILYWYYINFFENQQQYSTSNECSCVSQAAFLTKHPISVLNGCNLLIKFAYHQGNFIINPEN